METSSISSSLKWAELTMIVRTPKTPVGHTERSVSCARAINLPSWKITPIELPAPALEPPKTVALYPKPSISESIHRFVHAVANIAGVRCIAVEEADGHILHITTFADPLTEEIRSAIYAIEAAAIDDLPDLTFDFHLRRASEVNGGTPTPVPGQRWYAVWGSLDENAR